jgi:hypothetical protein
MDYNMINKVSFMNLCHNGDLHISRGFVREIAKICESRGIPCDYYHINDPCLLSDIPYVKYAGRNCGLPQNYKSAPRGDILFINTWYCSDPINYQKYSMTFDTLYYNFKDAVKFLDINLDDIPILNLFPSIDFTYFDIDKIKDWFNNHTNRRVFVSNGNALSGQSYNFPFSVILNKLAANNPNIDFLITSSETGIQGSNIYLTSNIILKNGCDLNENAYIAANCDLIIGRCSGPYSFAMTKETYFDNPKIFLAFTTLPRKEVVWTDTLTPPVQATFYVFDTTNDNMVMNAITEYLPNRNI